jgi:hypothetical protein
MSKVKDIGKQDLLRLYSSVDTVHWMCEIYLSATAIEMFKNDECKYYKRNN